MKVAVLPTVIKLVVWVCQNGPVSSQAVRRCKFVAKGLGGAVGGAVATVVGVWALSRPYDVTSYSLIVCSFLVWGSTAWT
jgi:hypothetical protein